MLLIIMVTIPPVFHLDPENKDFHHNGTTFTMFNTKESSTIQDLSFVQPL